MTFNPLRHVDPFGTVLLPALLYLGSGFCSATPSRCRSISRGSNHPRRDTVLVALAGPGTNVLLAIASALLFYTVDLTPLSVATGWPRNLVNSLQINALLCVFNMLPFPPLDGGRVAVGLLPPFLAPPLARVEPYGMLILMLIFAVSYIGVRSGVGFNLLGFLIAGPAEALIRFVLTITGHGQ